LWVELKCCKKIKKILKTDTFDALPLSITSENRTLDEADMIPKDTLFINLHNTMGKKWS
jgi:hypothetical protein